MNFQLTGGSVAIDNVSSFLEEVRYVASNCNTIIQAMDADKIAGEDHILFAVRKALCAKEKNTCIARDLGIEIMRYASGKRQIGEAFSMGVHQGRMNVVFVILAENGDIKRAVRSLEQMVEKMPVVDYCSYKLDFLIEQFSITQKEIEATGEDVIPLLVMERVALVDVLK